MGRGPSCGTLVDMHLAPRLAVVAFLIGLFAGPLAPPRIARASDGGPTNFVVILADDLGAEDLSCYGSGEHQTPNLDRLSAQGMRFETCWATPLCTPSRVMLMTGRYAFRTGWFQFLNRPYTPMRGSTLYPIGDQVTFSSLLDARGYMTALAGKWQLTGRLPDLVRDCGFDEYRIWAWRHGLPPGVKHDGRWEDKRERVPARYRDPCILEDGKLLAAGPHDYGPDLYCDFLVDFIRRHRSERLLAYYPMCLAHRPWESTPDPENPEKAREGSLATSVAYLDHLVGRLVGVLDELGLREKTLVVFTADNGTAGRGKGQVVERGVRVPLIASCPGTVPAGRVSDELVSLADLFPTVLEWAGVTLPPGHEIDGRTLVPVLRGEDVEHRPWVYSYLGEKKLIRDPRWLLDGRGRLYDTGYRQDGFAYRNRTTSDDADSRAARKRLEAILADLPGPEGLAEQLRQPSARRKPPR